MTESILEKFSGYYFEDLSVGMEGVYARTVTDADIVLFAGVSGDTNPVHLNDEYAKATPFKSRIAHGILTASLISTVIGTKLPGPGAIYVAQNLKFKAPVKPGDTVTAKVEVTSTNSRKKFVELETTCWVEGKCVLTGDATVMVPSKPSS